MRGKIRVLLDEKTDYKAVVETLGTKINQLNENIRYDEDNIRNIQNNLKEKYEILASHLKDRGQMLETLKKMKTVKKVKDIDVVVTNPSEKLSLDNPEIDLCLGEEQWKAKEEKDQRTKEMEKEREKENANNTN